MLVSACGWRVHDAKCTRYWPTWHPPSSPGSLKLERKRLEEFLHQHLYYTLFSHSTLHPLCSKQGPRCWWNGGYSGQAAGITFFFFILKIWTEKWFGYYFPWGPRHSTKGAMPWHLNFEEIGFCSLSPKMPEMVLVQHNNDNLKPQVKTSGEHWKVWTGSSFWEVCGSWEQSNPGYII